MHNQQHLSFLVLPIRAYQLIPVHHQSSLLRLQQHPLEVPCAVPGIPRQIQLLEAAGQQQGPI